LEPLHPRHRAITLPSLSDTEFSHSSKQRDGGGGGRRRIKWWRGKGELVAGELGVHTCPHLSIPEAAGCGQHNKLKNNEKNRCPHLSTPFWAKQ
jgi:hypothetical protein